MRGYYKKAWVFLFLFLFFSCSQSPKSTTQVEQTKASDEEVHNPESTAEKCELALLTLFESWPTETELDNEHIADAADLWLKIIQSAQESLDFSEFYAVNSPNSKLDTIIQAIKDAGNRGVKIRFIVDKSMLKDDNAALVKEIENWPNTQLRIIDYNAISGGVQHAKYFIVDNKVAFFGSQNFDWRSLEHISEMGVLIRQQQLVQIYAETFQIDWLRANDPKAEITKSSHKMPITLDYKGEESSLFVAISPKSGLSDDSLWDLPQILKLIDEAKTKVDIQLLNYSTVNYDKSEFKEIDDALIRAAQRGVQVRLMVSDWSKRKKYIADLKRLEEIPNISTKMIVIPEASTGFIPYSRTIHSKFMTVDQDASWIGTSNWSGDYFYNSRNVGLIVKGAAFNHDLSLSFEKYWNSPYAESTDPLKEYEPRRQY